MTDPVTTIFPGLTRMPSAQALALRALRLRSDTALYDSLGATLSKVDAACGVPANGHISAIAKLNNVPARLRITLLDHRTLRPVAATWSNPETGAYCFANLIPGRAYLVICDDYSQTYNAACADWVFPEVPI